MSAEMEIERYKALLDTARCFGRAMDLRSLTDEILERSREVMRAEACSLLLPDPKSKDLILYSTDPRVAGLPKSLKVPAGQGFAGEVFATRKVLNIRDAQQDPRHYKPIGEQVGFVTRAILSIPLLDGANCLGVLQAMNPRDREFFNAQDEEIFEGFGGLIVNALLRLEAQRREIDRAQAERELLLAREIQNSFLPSGIQEFPFAKVHLSYLPARVVGGDFYFVHSLGADRLLLGVGDVTGKGVPAALTMARVTAIIEVMGSRVEDDLGQWVSLLNRHLVQDLKGGRFLAMTFLLADAKCSALQICTAGQFAPFHFQGEQWSHSTVPNHLPLGISPEAKYHSHRTELKPGQFWLSFSDGIPEARNVSGEEFTASAFLQSLPVDQTGKGTVESALRAWRHFMGSAPQHDDISLLLLDWRGSPPPHELTTTCCPETLGQCRDFIEHWSKHAGYPDLVVGQIVMACDEAVTNILRHGYQQKPGPIQFHAEISNGQFCVRMIDQARPVDVTKIKPRSLSDLRPGGLGTFIISKVFDDVHYDPQDHGTTLTLKKQLPN